MALLGSLAMLASSLPAQAASPTPTPSPKPNAAARPSPLPANAAKPGVKPKAAARRISNSAAVFSAPSAMLPATNCLAGVCNLWAQAGTIMVPGDLVPLPIWGFSTSPTPGSGVLAGPTLIVSEKDSIKIVLTNLLPTADATLPASPACPADPRCISLDIPALSAPVPPAVPAATWPLPDTKGIEYNKTKEYVLGNLPAGTYIYEAGPTPHGQRQIRMGLGGLLIVRPKDYSTLGPNGPLGGAYDGPAAGTTSATFEAEAVMGLNEFDREFNMHPFAADPVDFNSNVFTLNGRAYNPDPLVSALGKIDVGPGNVLLLRYANFGTHDRGLTILNHRQRVLAEDSNILRNPTNVAAAWLTAGQVSDSFVSIDPQVPHNTHIPIFESGYHLNNGPDMGLGGAMTYLDVVSGVDGVPDGPLTGLAISSPNSVSNTNTGVEPLNFTVTIAASAGGGTLQDAEWFLDGVGRPGTGYKFNSTTYATCTPSSVAGLASAIVNCQMTGTQVNNIVGLAPPVDGDHIIWAHGLDANGWGVVSGDVFTVNATGPLVSAMTLHVGPTNGARYTDAANGASHTHVVNGLRMPCTVADVPSPECPAVADDKPTMDMVLLGTATASLADWVVLGGEFCLVPASLTFANCNSTTVSPLITTPGATTPGATPTSPPVYAGPYAGANAGQFPDGCVPLPSPAGVNSPALGAAPGGGSIVSFCAVVPASKLNVEGDYKLYFRAYEASGNVATTAPRRWGVYNETDMLTFTVDTTGPTASGASIDNNPNNGKIFSAGNLNFLDSIQVTATLDDSKHGNSNIVSGEVFLTKATVTANPVPPAQYGTGAEMVPAGAVWDSPTKVAYAYLPLAELTAYPEGLVRFWVHGKDEAGNWGTGADWTYVDLILDRTPPLITSASIVSGTGCTGLPTGCTVTYSANDPLSGGVNSNIVLGEWFTGTDPGQGLGFRFTVAPQSTSVVNGTFKPIAAGGTQISFRVKDAAGNWSLVRTVLAP